MGLPYAPSWRPFRSASLVLFAGRALSIGPQWSFGQQRTAHTLLSCVIYP